MRNFVRENARQVLSSDVVHERKAALLQHNASRMEQARIRAEEKRCEEELQRELLRASHVREVRHTGRPTRTVVRAGPCARDAPRRARLQTSAGLGGC
eukprot:254270-Prymnesium_polylepis.2